MATDKPKTPLTPEKELARRSRRSFIALGTGAVAAAGGWYWLNAQPLEDEIPRPLRGVLAVNERVVRSALYSENHLVRTYPASAIGKLKVNGDYGLDQPLDIAAWHLDLAPLGTPPRALAIDDIRALPRFEETIDFKCVEGWSTVTRLRTRGLRVDGDSR